MYIQADVKAAVSMYAHLNNELTWLTTPRSMNHRCLLYFLSVQITMYIQADVRAAVSM